MPAAVLLPDLFCIERVLTPRERKQLCKKRAEPTRRGHVMPPGSGPQGETCKTCKHLYRNRMAKTYLKCELSRARWTGGGATDVQARDPACSMWERA